MLEILENPLYVVAGAGLLALVFAFVRSQTVNRADPGPENMQTIAGHIREGAMAFLQREYRALSIFVVVVAGLLAFANMSNMESHWLIALSFVVGAFCSGLAGFIGMRVATAGASHWPLIAFCPTYPSACGTAASVLRSSCGTGGISSARAYTRPSQPRGPRSCALSSSARSISRSRRASPYWTARGACSR